MYDRYGTELSFTVGAGKFTAVPVGDVPPVSAIRLRSGTGAAAVAQGADRSIGLVFRDY